jgi:hypothetical protein
MARSERTLFALAFSAFAMSACAGILSLDEFQKGECPGAKCGDGGDLPDAFTSEGGSDAGPDVKIDGAPGTEPVSWARWPMPNYDAGAVLLPHQLDYDAGTTDEVTDKTTGLTWRRKPLLGDFSIEDAKAACAKEPNGPWRLPKRIELVTLLDYGQSAAPFIDRVAFPSFPAVPVWSSSPVRELDLPSRPQDNKPITKYWTVDFRTGSVDATDLAGPPQRALCVKGK